MQIAPECIEDHISISSFEKLNRPGLVRTYDWVLFATESVLAAAAIVAAVAIQVAVAPAWLPDVGRTGTVGLLILATTLFSLSTQRNEPDGLSAGAFAAIGGRCAAAVFTVAVAVRMLAEAPPVPGTFYLLAGLTIWAAAAATRAAAPGLHRLAQTLMRRYKRRVLIVTDQTCREVVDLVDRVTSSARVASVRNLPSDPAQRPTFLQRTAREVDPSAQDEIWLAVSWTDWTDIAAAMEQLAAVPLPVRLLPDPAALRILGHCRAERGDLPTFELRPPTMPAIGCAAKRLLDITGALVGLILLAPLLLSVAAAVRLDSPGPVVFRQTRGGRYGRPFRIWKFRTMRVVEDGQDIAQATRDDARVTVVGRWLRTTSIDELPQLLNVLHGEMSLIGPRPHALAHDAQYAAAIQEYPRRYHVKPGLTGWAQINGSRGETAQTSDMIKRVSLDVWYANNWSFWLDIKILLQTVSSARAHRSAY